LAQLGQLILQAQGAAGDTDVSDFLLNFKRPEPISDAEFERRQIAAWEFATGKKATFTKG